MAHDVSPHQPVGGPVLRALWNQFFPPPRITRDPDFGRLLFSSMPDPDKSYWEGEVYFQPARAKVEVFVDAGEEGPGQPQRDFYRTLEARYDSVQASVAPVLARAYADWLDRAPPDDVFRVFTLSSLSIPRREAPDSEWDMSFECGDDREHLFTVQLRRWTPNEEVGIDG
jgi:hypothetical protein